jgi:hypothetical protein
MSLVSSPSCLHVELWSMLFHAREVVYIILHPRQMPRTKQVCEALVTLMLLPPVRRSLYLAIACSLLAIECSLLAILSAQLCAGNSAHTLTGRHTVVLRCITVRVLFTRAGCAGLKRSIVLATMRSGRVQRFCTHEEGLLHTFWSFSCVWRIVRTCSHLYGEGLESSNTRCRNHRKAGVRPRTLPLNDLSTT